MKVFQDFISKLDSTEKHESNFGNLCTKKGGSFQKERFSFLLKSSMGEGGFDPRNPSPVRTPLIYNTVRTITKLCEGHCQFVVLSHGLMYQIN